MKIDRDKAVEMILDSHQGFLPSWEAHLEFWEGEKPGITNDFSEYAIYVRDLVQNKEIQELSVSMELIERFILEGDDNVQYGATIGFLEDITNMLSWADKQYVLIFSKQLKPKAREFCQELDRMWGTLIPGL